MPALGKKKMTFERGKKLFMTSACNQKMLSVWNFSVIRNGRKSSNKVRWSNWHDKPQNYVMHFFNHMVLPFIRKISSELTRTINTNFES